MVPLLLYVPPALHVGLLTMKTVAGITFIPAMLFLLKIPMRIAIGIASSTAVLIGRLGTNQIPWLMSAVLVAGVIAGAQAGSALSQRTPRRLLRGILSVLIAGSAMKICYELLNA
jgi:hypothetical protein